MLTHTLARARAFTLRQLLLLAVLGMLVAAAVTIVVAAATGTQLVVGAWLWSVSRSPTAWLW